MFPAPRIVYGGGNLAVQAAEGDEVTDIANIVDGKSYYIKGVRNVSKVATTFYLKFTDTVGSQSGTESKTTEGAQLITFIKNGEGSTYHLKTASGHYIAPGTSNGKITVSESPIAVTASNQSSKIRLSIGSGDNIWSIQKNTSAANFGGYKNTQTDITLIEGVPADTRKEIATIGALTPTSLAFGATGTFTLPIDFADGTTASDYAVTWESSNTEALLLDDNEYVAGTKKGNVTVTVSVEPVDDETYKPVSKEFTVNIYDPKGLTAGNPLTAAEAYDRIKDGDYDSDVSYYVSGIVTRFQGADIMSDNTSYRYYFSADGTATKEMLSYGGKGLNNVAFASADDLQVGDDIVVCGPMTLYSSQPEMNSGNYIYSLVRKTAPGLAYAVSSYDTYPNASFATPVLTNPNGLAVTYSSDDEDVAMVDHETGEVLIIDEGTAVITASFAGDATYRRGSASYTINVARTDAGFSFSAESQTVDLSQSEEISVTFSNPNNLTGIVFASSNEDVATISNTGVITRGAGTGTTVITATYAQTDQYRALTATTTITVNATTPYVEPAAGGYYVKVTSDAELTAGQYLIVNESKKMAFKSSLASSSLDASKNYFTFTLSEGKITANSTTTANEVTIDPEATTILTASGLYIGRESGENGMDKNAKTKYTNTFTFDKGNAVITGKGGIKLQCLNSSGSETFKYYKSNQLPVQLYKYVSNPAPSTVTVQVSTAGLGTYASNFDLDFSKVSGLEAYKASVDGTNVTLTQVTEVPAGEGVLLRVTNGSTDFSVPTTTGVSQWNDNALKRGTGAAVASEEGGKYNFILNIVDNSLGFYRAAGQTVAKNRAYLQTTTAAARIGISFDDATGIVHATADNVSSRERIVTDLQGRRVARPSRGLYIIDGKKTVVK